MRTPVTTRKALSVIIAAVFVSHTIWAQDEYLSTFNYLSLQVQRVTNIPGVTWIVADNSTYDANHQRFFFQGNATAYPPWVLFTVDAISGKIISQPFCPSAGGGRMMGLQYDNKTDTLWGLYSDLSGNVYFSWIEPATGIVHPKSIVLSYEGYICSTYDAWNRRYIFSNNQAFTVIDAASGARLYNNSFPSPYAVSDLQYDNITGRLYGIGFPGPGQPPQFVSISITTGVIHPISNLPAFVLPQDNTYGIDELSGKYIFVATDPSSSSCVKHYLYILDINTGKILSATIYPYDQNASANLENVIAYSFDNKRDILYALNWHPPDSLLIPTVHISVLSDSICNGQDVRFTAHPGPGVTNPSYQWEINHTYTGADTPVFQTSYLRNGDTVRCVMINRPSCQSPDSVRSDSIIMQVSEVFSSVTIDATADTICSGQPVICKATSINGGNDPVYQWMVNGLKAGSNDASYTSDSFSNGDIISCLLKGSITCSVPATSNEIRMTVYPAPTVLMGNDTVIVRGSRIALMPVISGDIYVYTWIPAAGLDNPSIPNPVASPDTTTTYYLTVKTAEGCSASAKKTIYVTSVLHMPGAFTPNGDGKNDVFRIPASTPQEIIYFSVFNRFGERVFFSENNDQGWDGTFRSRPQPPGTYVWEIRYQDRITGKPAMVSGTVMLIR